MRGGFAKKCLWAGGLAAAVTLGLCAGCTSGGASSAAASGNATSTSRPPAPSASSSASGSGSAVPTLSGRALASPGCSSATAAGPRFGSAGTTSVETDGSPFGVAATPDGRWAFAATSGGPGLAAASSPSVEVLRLTAGPGTGSAPTVTKVRSIPLPASPAGAAVTPDGKYLIVAEGSGAAVISVARAEAGTAGAVLGTLTAPSKAGGRSGPAGSAIEIAVSPDSRFVFVTLEYDQEAAVFNLPAALARGSGTGGYVGAVPLGEATVGMAVSPDGRWLYATSEGAVASQHPVGLGPPGRCRGNVPGAGSGEPPGTLTVIDLRGPRPTRRIRCRRRSMPATSRSASLPRRTARRCG